MARGIIAQSSAGGGGGGGTVTSFSAGTLSPLFTTSVANSTTTPALSFAQVNQNANIVYAGPSSGGAAAPTFRALVTADLASSIITYAKIQNEAGVSLLGNPTGSAAAPSEITLGSGLSFSGTTLVATGAVASVSNSDGTLTVSPTTGNVVASLALGHANTWTATQTFNAATAITLGAASGNTGLMTFKGTTSGTVTLSTADAAGTWTMKLPTSAGTNLYVLQTDGSGNTSWVAQSGGGSPGGSDTQVQFNDSSAFGGSSKFTFNKTTGAVVHTSASATAFTIGVNGATNPAFLVDASTASSATGVSIKSAAAGGKVTITSLSSASAEDINLDAKGGGTIYLANSTAALVFVNAPTTISAELTMGANRSITISGSGRYYGGDPGVAPFVLNSAGSDYGKIQNDSADLWSLAHATTGNSTLGTPVLQWNKSNNVLLPNGIISNYKGVATAGWGIPAIYAAGRATAQTAANASVATYTVGAADGSFDVCANVLVTTSTLHNFTVTCAYTDEGNTARVLTLQFSNLAGTFLTAIANAAGAVPYEGVAVSIRCKASTAITIASAAGGTYTTVTYNIEGFISQKS